MLSYNYKVIMPYQMADKVLKWLMYKALRWPYQTLRWTYHDLICPYVCYNSLKKGPFKLYNKAKLALESTLADDPGL